jgi:uncharacterized protein
MAEDLIRYDSLAQDALRGVIRTVLRRVAVSGLPGEHHLYIAFDTQAGGVNISDRLKEQYPEEMTVVLQYQFWDLEVSENRFEVKLAFNNIPERLVIPFKAIKAFYDPSVQFGLQFGQPGAGKEGESGEIDLPALVNDDKAGGSLPIAGEQASDDTGLPEPVESNDDAASAEVVELDAFRKR